MDTRIAAQLERLNRRYHAAKIRIDYVECLDLAHCLRVWTEIADDKESLGSLYDLRNFRACKPSRKSMKALRRANAQYLWLHTANYNYAECIQLGIFMPEPKDLPFTSNKLSSESQIAPESEHNPPGLRGAYLGTSLEGEKQRTDLTEKLNLTQFLSSQILIYCIDGKIHRYDARYIVKRLANGLLDASHFQDLVEGENSGTLKEALPVISKAKVGMVSMMYFILLYIAQEILIGFGKKSRVKLEGKAKSKP